MPTKTLKLHHTKYKTLYKNHPDFDILNHDFHDTTKILKTKDTNLAPKLKAKPILGVKSKAKKNAKVEIPVIDNTDIEDLKALQRMMRLVPDSKIADNLISNGFDSAHKISHISLRTFKQKCKGFIKEDAQIKEIYNKANHVVQKSLMLYGNIKDTVASPYYKASSLNSMDEGDATYYTGIPNYQQLFGSLNYLQCEDCQSIFSPAAYFLDIMRITDEYITHPNSTPVNTIPPHYKLEDRRPDLFEMKLDCENTNSLIPYLQLVNSILKRNIEKSEGYSDAYKQLAIAQYPISLPYNLPLSQSRTYLSKVGLVLKDVFQSILNNEATTPAITDFDIACESLGISYLQYLSVCKENIDVDSLTNRYGYNIKYQPDDINASGRVFFLEGQKNIKGIDTLFKSEIQVNDFIIIADEMKKVISIESDSSLTVDENWNITAGSEYTVIQNTRETFYGDGKITLSIDSDMIIGVNTKFTTQLKIGDQLNFAGQVATVVKIESDTSLKLNITISFFASDITYTVVREGNVPYKGEGVVIVSKGKNIIYGNGTNFKKDFILGSSIKVNDILLKVTVVDSDTQLTTESNWDFNSGNNVIVKPQAKTKPINSYLTHNGTGTITTTINSTLINGVGTKFTSELNIGDQIRCAGEDRTVKAIISDLQLEVLDAFTLIITDSNFEILPAMGLDILDNFITRCTISRDELQLLFNQDLSKDELKDNVALTFYINNTGEKVPYLQTYFSNDPTNPIQRIEGITLKRLDRINRFVKLSKIVNWNFTELNWLFTTFNSNSFSNLEPDLFIYLAAVKNLQIQLIDYSLIQLTSLWSTTKFIGKISDKNPKDLFDSTFNNPIMLNGKNPYKDNVPFNPTKSISWVINDNSESNNYIKLRLSSALMLSNNDVVILGNYVNELIGGISGTLEVSILSLSWMYAIKQWMDILSISLDELQQLLCLLFYSNSNYLKPSKDVIKKSPNTIDLLIRSKNILDTLSLNIYTLNYIVKGETGTYYEAPYKESSIDSFQHELVNAAMNVRLNASDLMSDNIDIAKATFIYDKIKNVLISDQGIFLKNNFTYEDAASYFPITAKDDTYTITFYENIFNEYYSDISKEESTKVYNKLLTNPAKPILISKVAGSAILSATYSDNVDLSFLEDIFNPNEAQLKINKIRNLLNDTNFSNIQLLKIWTDFLDKQELLFQSFFVDFLGGTTMSIKSLTNYAVLVSKVKNYLSTFLSTDITITTPIKVFIQTLCRSIMLSELFSFSTTEMSYIFSSQGAIHFNINDISNLSIDTVFSFNDYSKFVSNYSIKNNELIAFFKLPKDTIVAGPKVTKLASITGWEVSQINNLIDYFWNNDKTKVNDYDSIAGLNKLATVFNVASKLGAQVSTIIDFKSIVKLELEKNGVFIEANWLKYEALSNSIIGAVGTMLDNTNFQLEDTNAKNILNTQIRDVLLPFSIWTMNAKDPSISKVSDLYNYLLIDIEMSSCAITSKIAQGISSVQLYMQRARMMLERGIIVLEIPVIWWQWMSSYRVWEVNRKIFLYPENYIEPSLRSNVTPTFAKFSDELLQNEINKTNVKAPFQNYLQEINALGNLIIIASYNATRKDSKTGEEKESLFLFGRTNTQPYTYYLRTLDDISEWGPWRKIDIAINASNITPVYAFDRIFIFWSEKSLTQTSVVTNLESTTQSVEIIDLKYSFFDGQSWMHPQILYGKVPVSAYPSNYPSIQTNEIITKLNDENSYWNVPYVLSNIGGNVGAGRINITINSTEIKGVRTRFNSEIKIGDLIYCLGEKRQVISITNDNLLNVDKIWTKDTLDAEYKIVASRKRSSVRSFIGKGKVIISADLQNVSGEDTEFLNEISYGDNIIIGEETRMVVYIKDNTTLIVDNPWKTNASRVNYTITPKKNTEEQLLVLLGGDLSTNYNEPFKAPDNEPNPTKNYFIGERAKINNSMYNSLIFMKQMKELKINGNVTLGPAQIVDGNLLKSSTGLMMTEYNYAAKNNPTPYKAVLARQQTTVAVLKDSNPILNNYWGNNIAGTANAWKDIDLSDSKKLLYYINETNSSLINVGNQTGWFIFDNSDESFLIQAQETKVNKLSEMALIRPYPILPIMLNNKIISSMAYSPDPVPFTALKFKFTRLTTSVIPTLLQRLFAGGIDNLLTINSQELSEQPFSRFYPAPGNDPAPSVIPPTSSLMDFDGSYGLYFWEIFFHCPFLVADKLMSNKKFEDAKDWIQYIFNPTINEDDSANPDPEKRYWRFKPFRTMTRESLKDLLTNDSQIRRYNYSPFDPDMIAKYRHSAYAKAIVMKYVANIIEWADMLFARDTSEDINQATNLYMLANDLLGKRPEILGKLELPEPKSFNEIRAAYPDHIPQFLIELENTPEINTVATNVLLSSVPFNRINSYFCVPENTDFIKYWDTIEDRLFKIRNCQNINGVFRQLALFAPPIDPRAFIRAYSSGGANFGGASSFNVPIPAFKASYLIEKARLYISQVSNLGNALLAAIEKKDAEALNAIRLKQEMSVLQLTTTIKELQIKNADELKATQNVSLNSADFRYKHYDQLMTDGISKREQVSMDAALAAMILNTLGGITKTAASIGYAIPQVGSPFAMTYGGQQLGNVLNAASGAFEIGSIISNYVSQQALTMAGYDRRKQEWTLQREIAKYDKGQIELQLKQTEIQKKIAEQELVIQKQNIINEEILESYYKEKFTSQELYQWMLTRISTIYFQSYNLAFAMAKAAERAYQFQYNTERTFINYGYWNDLYKGLGAADGLILAIDQMESNTILDSGSRCLEIEKTISLLQLNPKALLDLKNTGECIFEFTEKLFDVDFPGHYARKIKSISISIPALVGPYQNVHATFTQLSNQIIIKSDKQGLDAVNYLLGAQVTKIPDSSVLRTNWSANQQIAISRGINDSGLFQLNFDDVRFLPFEGTGAVSTWKLSLPKYANRINFDSIADIIISLNYTAQDGGDKFKQDVMKLSAFKPYAGIGYLNLAQMYASPWYTFMNDHTSTTKQTINFEIKNFIPPNINSAKLVGFYLKLDASVAAAGKYITFQLTDSIAIECTLAATNDFNYFFKIDKKTEPTIDKVLGNRAISFDLKTAPSSIKTTDNFLDANIIKNIEIIFYYQGELT